MNVMLATSAHACRASEIFACCVGVKAVIAPSFGDIFRSNAGKIGLLVISLPDDEVKTFIAMRYWHPLTEETAADVAAFGPDGARYVTLREIAFDRDSDVDLVDFTHFQSCFNGPNRPAACP